MSHHQKIGDYKITFTSRNKSEVIFKFINTKTKEIEYRHYCIRCNFIDSKCSCETGEEE